MTTLVKAETGYTYAHPANIEILDCANCGILFGIPVEFANRRRNDGRDFYCPNGHPLAWSDTEVKRLRRKLENAQTEINWQRDMRQAAEADAAHQRRMAGVAKGKLTRMRNRIAKGVCPVPGCKRSGLGGDVVAHIHTCHPEFTAHLDG